jgi:N-formylglutamate deformylase
MVALYDFREGDAPLLISMPHCGTHIPPHLAVEMTDEALEVPDTDFHLPRLYDFAHELGVPVLSATHSRYVIDLNRSPDGSVLYPGASNTELCPLSRFDFKPIYRAQTGPSAAGVSARVNEYWKPYHRRIESELARIRERHGYALLFDAHSIISECPRFFEGCLADFNLGTGGGTSCDPRLGDALLAVAERQPDYTSVLNGRFKGGYITRQYGRPADDLHAVQLELSTRTYMIERPPFDYDEVLASRVRVVLRELIETLLAWKPGVTNQKSTRMNF